MNQDEEHLKLLSIFHYVLGGLMFVFGCFPIIHLTIGIMLVTGGLDGNDARPPFLGWIFIILPAIFILGMWVLGVLLLFAGKYLRQHRNRTYCFVVAAVSCLFFPLGTTLGVFTIIVLSRPSVLELFESTPDSMRI